MKSGYVMTAETNRMENAARIAMADLGAGSQSGNESPVIPLAVKTALVLAALALTGLTIANLI